MEFVPRKRSKWGSQGWPQQQSHDIMLQSPTSITQHPIEALAGKCVTGVMLWKSQWGYRYNSNHSWCGCVLFDGKLASVLLGRGLECQMDLRMKNWKWVSGTRNWKVIDDNAFWSCYTIRIYQNNPFVVENRIKLSNLSILTFDMKNPIIIEKSSKTLCNHKLLRGQQQNATKAYTFVSQARPNWFIRSSKKFHSFST